MHWTEAESILDNHSALKALAVNGRRSVKSYTSGYESPNGRHIVLERRTSGPAKLYFQVPFEVERLGLTSDSSIKYYSATEARAGLERASRRFAVGNPIVCVKVAGMLDLQKLLAAEAAI